MNEKKLKQDLEKTIEDAKQIIDVQNWEERYKNYAKLILKNTNIMDYRRRKFHKWEPFKYYLTISDAKDSSNKLKISVRYQGQIVADLAVEDEKVLISTEKYDTKNFEYFGCNVKCKNIEWKDATQFRKYFNTHPKRTKNNDSEHRMESLLIDHFSLKSSKEKCLLNVQPIKIATFPFSMKTIVSGSHEELQPGDGAIDILTRRKRSLLAIELKNENKPTENIEKVLKQNTGYAVFLLRLLRSDFGQEWYKIFGFREKLQKKLLIRVCGAMPRRKDGSYDTFTPFKLEFENDILEYHWLYFDEDGTKVNKIYTSLEGESNDYNS